MTYYEILEISENASQEVIRMAYKALCKKYHPDICQGDKKQAEERMKKINEAYDTLSDETKKRQYDYFLNTQSRRQQSYYTPKQENSVPNADALVKRGFMALEYGEWIKAENFFEQALNQNAGLAESYLGKLMVELRVKTRNDLKNCTVPFDDKINYQRAFRFAQNALKDFLADTIQFIKKRNYEAECNEIYCRACELMQQKEDIDCLKNAIVLFKTISEYKDSSSKIKECEEEINRIKEEKFKIDEINKLRTQKLVVGFIFVAFILTVFIIIGSKVSNNNKYNLAVALIDEEKYAEAITVLEKLDNYKNSNELEHEAQYLYANKLYEENNYIEAKKVFEKVLDYKDSEKYLKLCNEQINEINYQKSLVFINEDKFIEAYELLKELSSKKYKDSKELMSKYNKYYEQAVFKYTSKNAEIGSVVTFGSYEQDDNLENGKEPVNWIVIDRNETSVMLISEKIIEIKAYHDNDREEATWEKSSLRQWLNESFFNTAFNDIEKQMIADTIVKPDPKEYSTSPDQGSQTIDKIYMLSENEYYKYDHLQGVSNSESSRYVIAQNYREEPTFWWLRSSDEDYESEADSICNSRVCGWFKDSAEGVRPVIWVKFE